MITHKHTYRGVDFSDSLAKDKTNRFALQDVGNDSAMRTDFTDQAFSHATRSSQTYGSGRTFDFTGKAFGTKTERQTAMDTINAIIQPEGFPSETNRGFYELSRYNDDETERYKVQAKATNPVRYNNEIANPIIDFTFSLYSETYRYYGYVDKQVVGDIGLLGGVNLVNQLAISPGNGSAGGLLINNEGNFNTPINISCTDELVNPVIYNSRTNYYYKLIGTFNDLSIVFDQENFNYDILEGSTRVAYLSTNLSLEGAFRAVPGVNYITVTSENYSLSGPNASITIDYNDAFASN